MNPAMVFASRMAYKLEIHLLLLDFLLSLNKLVLLIYLIILNVSVLINISLRGESWIRTREPIY